MEFKKKFKKKRMKNERGNTPPPTIKKKLKLVVRLSSFYENVVWKHLSKSKTYLRA